MTKTELLNNVYTIVNAAINSAMRDIDNGSIVDADGKYEAVLLRDIRDTVVKCANDWE